MAFNVAKIASARASLTISLTKSLRVAGPLLKVGLSTTLCLDKLICSNNFQGDGIYWCNNIGTWLLSRIRTHPIFFTIHIRPRCVQQSYSMHTFVVKILLWETSVGFVPGRNEVEKQGRKYFCHIVSAGEKPQNLLTFCCLDFFAQMCKHILKLYFRQYPAIHTNYSWSNCTISN